MRRGLEVIASWRERTPRAMARPESSRDERAWSESVLRLRLRKGIIQSEIGLRRAVGIPKDGFMQTRGRPAT